MTFTRMNILEYRAPLTTLGDLPDTESILSVLDKYDFVIVDKQAAGPANDALVEILNAVKTMNEGCKVFGRIDLTGVASSAAATALVDAWVADVPVGVLAGFCLVPFEFQAGFVDRAIQNAVVDYIHAMEKAVVVDSASLMNIFEPYGMAPAPAFGRTPTIRDFVLLRDVMFVNQGVGMPALTESVEKRHGRLEYLMRAHADKLTGLSDGLNFGILALAGAGDAAFLTEENFKKFLRLANAELFDGVGIEPDDGGAASHRFFLSQVANATLDA